MTAAPGSVTIEPMLLAVADIWSKLGAAGVGAFLVVVGVVVGVKVYRQGRQDRD